MPLGQPAYKLSYARILACVPDPLTLVLNTTKSGCVAFPQFALLISNENFAGKFPAPTVAFGPSETAQSRFNALGGLGL